jgi:hypothetical protein
VPPPTTKRFERLVTGGAGDRPRAGVELEAAAVAARARRAVRRDGGVPDLTGAASDALVQTSVQDERAADAGTADDTEHVSRAAAGAEVRLREPEGMAVVQHDDVAAERALELDADVEGRPVPRQVGEERGACLRVEDAGQADAHGVDGACERAERGGALEHRGRAGRRPGRSRLPVDDPLALEHGELDVRPADVEPEPPRHARILAAGRDAADGLTRAVRRPPGTRARPACRPT